MKPMGLHLPNDKPLEQHHWDIIKRVQPGIVLLCEPYFSDVPRLRETVPGIVIVGRMYGDGDLGISNWSRPDDRALVNMVEFGRRSGRKADQYDIDIMTPFNEPSIDWNLPTDPDGFAFIAQVFLDWLAGYREATRRKAGTIALAPGGREDDDGGWGYRGADILRPAFQQADVLILHNYWNEGNDTYGVPLVQSEWEGDRASRQLAAYEWGKEWGITEFNRPAKRDDEKPAIAEQTRVFIAQHASKPGFLGACWFLLDGRDDQFRQLRMVDNDHLINTAISINAWVDPAPPIPEPETPVSVVTALVVAALALVPGPQSPASKPAVWSWWERTVTETATFRPHLSAEDVVTIAFGVQATMYQESDGMLHAKGDWRDRTTGRYACSRSLFQTNSCGGAGTTLMEALGLTSADQLEDADVQYVHARLLITALESELYWSRQEQRPFSPGTAIQSVQRSSSDPTGAGYQAAYDTLRREATQEAPLATARIGNLEVPDLRPRYPSTYIHRPLGDIANISIHHSVTATLPETASEADEMAEMDAIHAYHRTQFRGISYHMVVCPSGNCYLTGDWGTTRYVVEGHNPTTLSILLLGTFTDTPPGDVQLDAAQRLIANVRYQLGNADLPVFGHRDLSATKCPGDVWEQWKQRLVGETPAEEPVDTRTPVHKELDLLWSYAQALRINGDNDNAGFVEARVIAIKQEVGLG